MIEAGAAAVHFEDQLSSAKKCGHLGGKVLVPTRGSDPETGCGAPRRRHVRRADDPDCAHRRRRGWQLITSDCDPSDRPFLTGERTVEGFFRIRGGIDAAIARGLAYASYADMLWCETSEPNMAEARSALPTQFMPSSLARCWPTIARLRSIGTPSSTTMTSRDFQRELGENRIPLPIRDAGRLPCVEPLDV